MSSVFWPVVLLFLVFSIFLRHNFIALSQEYYLIVDMITRFIHFVSSISTLKN